MVPRTIPTPGPPWHVSAACYVWPCCGRLLGARIRVGGSNLRGAHWQVGAGHIEIRGFHGTMATLGFHLEKPSSCRLRGQFDFPHCPTRVASYCHEAGCREQSAVAPASQSPERDGRPPPGLGTLKAQSSPLRLPAAPRLQDMAPLIHNFSSIHFWENSATGGDLEKGLPRP